MGYQSDSEYKDISKLHCSIQNQVALIRIKGLNKFNLIDELMAAEMRELLSNLDDNVNVRVMILSSVGEHFSTGSVLRELSEYHRFNSHRIASDIASVNKVTLASLRGNVLDQGLELALACDIRIAAEGASFGFTHLKSGSIPWDGGTQRLPRIIGPSRALYMLLTGKIIGSKQALEYGLISEITALSGDEKVALEFGAIIAKHGPIAVQYLKEAVHASADLTINEGMRLELDLATLLHSTNDRAEGLRAFAEKRTPEFRGD